MTKSLLFYLQSLLLIFILNFFNCETGDDGKEADYLDSGSSADSANQVDSTFPLDLALPDTADAGQDTNISEDTTVPLDIAADSAPNNNDIGYDTTFEHDVTAQAVPGIQVMWQNAGIGNFTKDTFWNMPWPEESRRKTNGTLDLAGFPNPITTNDPTCIMPTYDSSNTGVSLMFSLIKPKSYVDYVIAVANDALFDFGNNSAIYMRFTGELAQSYIPSVADSVTANAHIFLINFDPQSPTRGRKFPIEVEFHNSNNISRYEQPNTLVASPYPGFPMDPGAYHAFVVLRSALSIDGNELGSPLEFEELKYPTGLTYAYDDLYLTLFEYLESNLNIDRSRIAAATVFKTQDFSATLRQVKTDLETLNLSDAAFTITSAPSSTAGSYDFYHIQGTYLNPDYQKNYPPHLSIADILSLKATNDKGKIDINHRKFKAADNSSYSTETSDSIEYRRLEFSITLPKQYFDGTTPIPTAGIPLALYSHGTGGDHTTFVNSTGNEVAKLGIASIGIDQVMHGERANIESLGFSLEGLDNGSLFFNALNIYAAIGNVIQSGIDYLWMAKLMGNISFAFKGQTVKFDPAKIYFYGHSQGGLTGPLAAFSDYIKGVFLSAPGGHLKSSLIYKSKPDDLFAINEVIAYIICDSKPLDMMQPILNLFQSLLESADPMNYARYIAADNRYFTPKHLFMTEGVADHYAPPETNDPVTTAAQSRLVVEPGVDPLREVYGQTLLGYAEPFETTLQGNMATGGLQITNGFCQYTCGSNCSEDHFVSEDVPEAIEDWKKFFETILTGVPQIK